MITVGIESILKLPEYAKKGDSGMDVRACIDSDITLAPLERRLIPTGIKVDLPEGYEIQVRPRSGMTLRYGLTVLNTPGTVDSGFTGEIGVIMINLSNEPQTIKPGERIAQIVCVKVEMMEWEERTITKETERGSSGYGDSGKN